MVTFLFGIQHVVLKLQHGGLIFAIRIKKHDSSLHFPFFASVCAVLPSPHLILLQSTGPAAECVPRRSGLVCTHAPMTTIDRAGGSADLYTYFCQRPLSFQCQSSTAGWNWRKASTPRLYTSAPALLRTPTHSVSVKRKAFAHKVLDSCWQNNTHLQFISFFKYKVNRFTYIHVYILGTHDW